MPKAKPTKEAIFVIFRCKDEYATSLSLMDLLVDRVILADGLNGKPLTIEHGTPLLRLIVLEHYGYKNAKRLKGIEFWVNDRKYKINKVRIKVKKL